MSVTGWLQGLQQSIRGIRNHIAQRGASSSSGSTLSKSSTTTVTNDTATAPSSTTSMNNNVKEDQREQQPTAVTKTIDDWDYDELNLAMIWP
jgi:hypothetical protein